MIIDAVDFFYLAMPEVKLIGDGSQDALLVRVRSGDREGWGECEAAPLVSIASYVCPASHSACRPLKDVIMGRQLDSVGDIRRINQEVRLQCHDLLQADHTLSGIDIAMYDLLGKRYGLPVYRLLGYTKALPKKAYASLLFGDSPKETYDRAVEVVERGFRAAKFGWGPFGIKTLQDDEEQLEAAREGLGPGVSLYIDAGTVWGEDVREAESRLSALSRSSVGWLEEPFSSAAISAYRELARKRSIPIAGGEGSHKPEQAYHLIDAGGVRYIQVDAGRIGGISSAKDVVAYAAMRGVHYVNHTFTSHLALSASLHPYAGVEAFDLCEYPFEPSPLASQLVLESLDIDGDGCVSVFDSPGLGVNPDMRTVRKYIKKVEIRVDDEILFLSDSPG